MVVKWYLVTFQYCIGMISNFLMRFTNLAEIETISHYWCDVAVTVQHHPPPPSVCASGTVLSDAPLRTVRLQVDGIQPVSRIIK